MEEFFNRLTPSTHSVNRGQTRKGPQDLGERLVARSNGYIRGIVL
jgi:hypothetical protein